MHSTRWIVAALVVLNAGWMTFAGARALIAGLLSRVWGSLLQIGVEQHQKLRLKEKSNSRNFHSPNVLHRIF